LRLEAGKTAPLHVFGELARFFAGGDGAAFAAGKRRFGVIDGGEYFQPPTLASGRSRRPLSMALRMKA
jgi:hypothetical protein